MACEDTRRTRMLLDRYGVRAQLVSYHEHNEAARAAELVGQMRDGARWRSCRTPGCRSCPIRATCWCGRAWPRGSRGGAARAVGRAHRAGGVGAAGRPVAVRGLPAAQEGRAARGALASPAARWWRSSRRGACRPRSQLLAELDAGAPRGGLPRADEGARGGRARDRRRAGGALRGEPPKGEVVLVIGAARGAAATRRSARGSTRCAAGGGRREAARGRRRWWRS